MYHLQFVEHAGHMIAQFDSQTMQRHVENCKNYLRENLKPTSELLDIAINIK